MCLHPGCHVTNDTFETLVGTFEPRRHDDLNDSKAREHVEMAPLAHTYTGYFHLIYPKVALPYTRPSFSFFSMTLSKKDEC